jgi:hypothetical protein
MCAWSCVFMHTIVYYFVTTPALGSRTRQGLVRLWAKKEAWESHLVLLGVQKSVREWTLTLPNELPLWENWSPKWTFKFSYNDYRGQNPSFWIIFYIIQKLLERRCLKWARMTHLNIWNTSYGQKKGQESTRFLGVQVACNILLERSRWGLQLCFRPHCNPRFARKVMGPQSCGSPSCGNFGTLTWES